MALWPALVCYVKYTLNVYCTQWSGCSVRNGDIFPGLLKVRTSDEMLLLAPMALDLDAIGHDVEQWMVEDRAGEELVKQAFHWYTSCPVLTAICVPSALR